MRLLVFSANVLFWLASPVLGVLPWPERVGDYCIVKDNCVVELNAEDLMVVRRTSLAWLEQQDKHLRRAQERFEALQGKAFSMKSIRRELRQIEWLFEDLFNLFDGVELSWHHGTVRARYGRIVGIVDAARKLKSLIFIYQIELDEMENEEQ